MTVVLRRVLLHRDQNLRQVAERLYLAEGSLAFALALSRGLEWPLLALVQEGRLRHAVVRRPDGGLLDVRGLVDTPARLWEPFGAPGEIRRVSEGDLLSLPGTSDEMIEAAGRLAAALFPNLPWREDPFEERVRAFAVDLEALSRKHGLWIQEPFAQARPLVVAATGLEQGYLVEAATDGRTYTIGRTIEAPSPLDQTLVDSHAESHTERRMPQPKLAPPWAKRS